MGYLPIIQAPAHHINTLNTVVAQSTEQEHVVLTVDEDLYPKKMQALRQLLLYQLSAHLDSVDVELEAELDSFGPSSNTEAISQMVDTLAYEGFHLPILDFVKVLKEAHPNAEFWWNYMKMVRILLYFTRTEHDGLWEFHLYAFRHMLPFFRYDHVNYAVWGTVYLAEMAKLPPDIPL